MLATTAAIGIAVTVAIRLARRIFGPNTDHPGWYQAAFWQKETPEQRAACRRL